VFVVKAEKLILIFSSDPRSADEECEEGQLGEALHNHSVSDTELLRI